jgi:hypothetical protein
MICAGAEATVRHLGSVPLPDIELPAGSMSSCRPRTWPRWPLGSRVSNRAAHAPLRIEGDDPLEVYRSFVGITYITRVSRWPVPRPTGTWRACRSGLLLSPGGRPLYPPMSTRPGLIAKTAIVPGPPTRTEGGGLRLLLALAGADRPETATLRLVQCEVAGDRNRDGDGDESDPHPHQPRRENEK